MYTAMYTLPLSAPVAPWLHLTTVTGASSSSIPRKRASLWRSLTLVDLEPDVGVGNDGKRASTLDFIGDFLVRHRSQPRYVHAYVHSP